MKEKIKEILKRKRIKKILLVSSLFISLSIIIFLIIKLRSSHAIGEVENLNECITSSFGPENETQIEIIGSPSLTDDEGVNITPINYTVTNKCEEDVPFTIQLEINRNTTINDENIRVFHNNTLYNLQTLVPVINNRGLHLFTLYEGTLSDNSTFESDFRIWLSENLADYNIEESILSVQLQVIS